MNEFLKSDLYKKLNEHTISICDELTSYGSWMDMLDYEARLKEMVHKIKNLRAIACSNLNQYQIENDR